MGLTVLITILKIMGSLGIFILGMKLMTDSIQFFAGKRLRTMLQNMTRTRSRGVLTGFTSTALIQSSSATTVMAVSFVNAGLLTLSQSTGIIIGANIGTTVTAWLISYFGFRLQISVLAIILVGLVMPLLFSSKQRLRNIAEFVLGFAILFQGLEFLRNSLPDVRSNPEILQFLEQYTDLGFATVIIFVLVGALLTMLLQASSTSMTITMVMVSEGWIPFDLGCAMVLGENIGTTITANLAAIIGNVHAKRAARFHTLFNIIGVIWMITLFPYFLGLVDWINQTVFQAPPLPPPGSGYDVEATTVGGVSSLTNALAIFHTTFNVINALLLVGVTEFLIRIVIYFVPSKADKAYEKMQQRPIMKGIMMIPEVRLHEGQQEILQFGKLIEKMCANVMVMMFKEPKNREKLYNKIRDREDVTDRMQAEITHYMAQLGQYRLSEESAQQVKGFMRIATDLERMGDIFYKLAINKQRQDQTGKGMPESISVELSTYFDLVYAAIKTMNRNMLLDPAEIDMEQVYESEREINEMRDSLKQSLFTRMESGQYEVREGILYIDFVSSAEKLGDHILNVNQSLSGMK